MSQPTWIGLGSNLGDRQAILDAAVDSLKATPGIIVHAVSSYHETRAVGGPPDQGPFLNAAAHLETTLDPHQLLKVFREIENQAGRLRTIRWGERTLDLDLLFYAHALIDSEDLTLPHPRLAVRRFVLGPLAELAPNFGEPTTGRTIANLLANLDRKPRLVAIDGWDGDRKAAVFERLVEELPGFGISASDLVPPNEHPISDFYKTIGDDLEQKAEALKATRWAVETLRVPWIVADYSLDFDIFRATMSDPRKVQAGPDARARHDAHLEWKGRINGLLKIALPPTFVLVLPGDRDRKRRLGLTSPPLLWSETDDPDAVVAEVLATCRGIEGD
jgi:2-amino-4-hydroxy-6-hydroxymethyldihydropteridine diphosphokinase